MLGVTQAQLWRYVGEISGSIFVLDSGYKMADAMQTPVDHVGETGIHIAGYGGLA
jgi:hypothetical protein